MSQRPVALASREAPRSPAPRVAPGLWFARAAGLVAAALSGCARRAGASHAVNDDLVTQLVAEVDRLWHALSGPSLLSLLALSLAAWVLSRALDSAVRLAWRIGLDHERRLRPMVRWGNIAVVALVAIALLRKAVHAAPVLSSLIAITTAAGLVLALARPLQNMVSGAALILRGRMREGDHIELDDHAGTITEVGLLRLRVRDAEGQTVLIPNRLLHDRVVTVSRRTHLVPAVARVSVDGSPKRTDLSAGRSAALLSPWRVAGTPVRAWTDGDALLLELQTWSDAAVHPAREALEASLSAIVTKEGR